MSKHWIIQVNDVYLTTQWTDDWSPHEKKAFRWDNEAIGAIHHIVFQGTIALDDQVRLIELPSKRICLEKTGREIRSRKDFVLPNDTGNQTSVKKNIFKTEKPKTTNPIHLKDSREQDPSDLDEKRNIQFIDFK